MISRIEVTSSVTDTRALIRKKKIESLGFSGRISDIYLCDVYTIEKDFSEVQLNQVSSILSNPVTQEFVIQFGTKELDSLISSKNEKLNNNPKSHSASRNSQAKFDWAVEIGFLPGVTDNVAHTAKEEIEDLLKVKFNEDEGVYTSQINFISGDLTKKEIQEIAASLHNPLIQRVHIKNATEFKKDGGMDIVAPKVKIEGQGSVIDVDLDVTDEELAKIGREGILDPGGVRRGPLALDLLYMKTIKDHFVKLERKPTDIELESLAQTWSEHCKHTIFADPIDEIEEGLYKRFIKGATEKIRKEKGKNDFCVSVFTDNSGAISFDDKYIITHKVETHNTPSALDPFGGSITGIVGVNRDALGFGLGAKPVLNTYGFCFADPNDDEPLYKDQKLTQKMLSPKRIMEGVIEGVNSGGNQSGIPTTQGFVYFNDRYKGKPLVFVGTLGLLPKIENAKKTYEKKAQPGDYIVMIGGRVGLDGIHGATFSSEALSSGSPSTAVQIGDPITQKKLSDAISKEARQKNLYSSITDNGAGGLSCSVAEMAKESNGCKVFLEKVPLKYPGLDPWQIWISESQERMTLSVPKNKWNEFKKLMGERGVEATVIGEFTSSGKCVVSYNGKVVMDLELDFLHDGLPKKVQSSKLKVQRNESPEVFQINNFAQVLKNLLARLNVTSFEFISRQYDHEVQSESVLKPLQGKGRVNGEASIIRPVLHSNRGVVISQGLYPSYSEVDPYAMAACSIDTAIRNVVAAGADPEKIALLDNFCWCSANEPERLGQLKLACKACFDYAVAYGTPFISGKDSMFNDFKGFDKNGKPVKISVPPTLLISSVSVIDDISKSVSIDAKFVGDLVYVLGETFDELGSSEFLDATSSKSKQHIPSVDSLRNKELYKKYHEAIQKNLVSSAIAVTRGGLITAIAKKLIAGDLGGQINLKNLPGQFSNDTAALFSESQGRIVVTIAKQNKEAFENTFGAVSFAEVGRITEDKKLKVNGINDDEILNMAVEDLLQSYKETFGGLINNRKPLVTVISGYGINCEEETKYAFELSGAEAEIVHINDLINGQRKKFRTSQILAFPGGFAYGDDTGSGLAFANKVKNHLWEEVRKFVGLDNLVIGICNGFQILVNLGLLPALEKNYGEREVALLANDNAQYTDRWVDVSVEGESFWIRNIESLSVPIAHGEGKFFANDEILNQINRKKLVALRYYRGPICNYLNLAGNPNGSIENIAGITDETGKIFGLMPHPERAMFFTHLPNWPLIKEKLLREGKELPNFGPGLKIFENAVEYFK